jgi:hypothetical protein
VAKPSGPSKALKLGSKKKDVDVFVGQLQSEGESKQNNYKSMTHLKLKWQQIH